MRVNLILQKCQFGLQSSGLEFVNTQVVAQQWVNSDMAAEPAVTKPMVSIPEKVLMKVAICQDLFRAELLQRVIPG